MFDVCMHVCVLDREGELGVCKYSSSSSMDSCVSYWLQWLSDQILQTSFATLWCHIGLKNI